MLSRMVYLSMSSPAHPLVDKDGVGPKFIRYDHRLERVGLQIKKTTMKVFIHREAEPITTEITLHSLGFYGFVE
jgi:hypothetical protein